MRVLIALVLSGLFIVPAVAQQSMTREQTYQEIARTMATLNQARDNMPATTGSGRFPFEEALKMVEALRARLAGNPYVKVKGFSLGLPSGVNVEFEFKD